MAPGHARDLVEAQVAGRAAPMGSWNPYIDGDVAFARAWQSGYYGALAQRRPGFKALLDEITGEPDDGWDEEAFDEWAEQDWVHRAKYRAAPKSPVNRSGSAGVRAAEADAHQQGVRIVRYADYVDGDTYAYRVNTKTGAPEHFQYGTLRWVSMSGLGQLMAYISNGDAQQCSTAQAERTVAIIRLVKARREAGATGPFIEDEVKAEFDGTPWPPPQWERDGNGGYKLTAEAAEARRRLNGGQSD